MLKIVEESCTWATSMSYLNEHDRGAHYSDLIRERIPATLNPERCWVIGQSIKDAARKKSMYIVEHSGAAAMRAMYEPIWVAATVAVNASVDRNGFLVTLLLYSLQQPTAPVSVSQWLKFGIHTKAFLLMV